MSLTTATPSVTRRARSSVRRVAHAGAPGARPRLRVVRDGEVAPAIPPMPSGHGGHDAPALERPLGGAASPISAASPTAERSVAPRRPVTGPADEAPPIRLTRRGRIVVRAGGAFLVVLALAGGVLLMGRTAEAGSTPTSVPATYRVVLPGETLWQIAGEVAPGADRRDTVANIKELNALSSAEVFAGQRIAVPARPAGH